MLKGCLNFYCGPCYVVWCAMSSFMCMLWMLVMGSLIARDYPYVGEWYTLGEDVPSFGEQKAAASHTAFSTAGIYAAFLALSLLGIGFNKFYGRL